MGLIFHEPIERRYRAPWCSYAGCCRCVYIVVLIIVPYLVGVGTNSFWLKENTYTEQPNVVFKDQIIVMVEGSTPDLVLTYSNVPRYNDLMVNMVRVPEIRSYRDDMNGDNITDVLHVEFTMALKPGEAIHRARALIFTEVSLSERIRLIAEGLIYVDASSASPGVGADVFGDLALQQRYIVPFAGSKTDSMASVLDQSKIQSVSDVRMNTLLAAYQKKNETTYLTGITPVWNSGKGSKFTFHAHVRIPPQRITYQPGPAEALKLGFVQYLSLLILLWLILYPVQSFMFRQQIVDTHVSVDPIVKKMQ